MAELTQSRSKKSESIEVRLTHETKQAFMSKASVEGRSASEMIRRWITNYLQNPREGTRRPASVWKHGFLASAGMIAVLLGTPCLRRQQPISITAL